MSTSSYKNITSSIWGCKRKCTTMNYSRRERRFYRIKRKLRQLLPLSTTSKTILQIQLNKQLNLTQSQKTPRSPFLKNLKSLLRGPTLVTTTRNVEWSTSSKWKKVSGRDSVKSLKTGTISLESSLTIYSRWHSLRNKRRRCNKRSLNSKRWNKMLMIRVCE